MDLPDEIANLRVHIQLLPKQGLGAIKISKSSPHYWQYGPYMITDLGLGGVVMSRIDSPDEVAGILSTR